MQRREVFKYFAAGATASALPACGGSPVAEKIVALPPDVQPYSVTRPAPPTLLSKPAGTAFLAPRAPAYPCYDDRSTVLRDAQGLSDAFERYIRAWFEGLVPGEIPTAFLPPGINRDDYPRFTLRRPEEVQPQQQWSQRGARPITRDGYVGFFPDPNVTYLVVPAMYLPFGSRVVIEGEYPHARFFDVQVTPSFTPENYHYDGSIGVGEVPIVDADIDPLPGSTNPFRVSANRSASNRSYRVVLQMSVGDPVGLNPAFRPPYFRGAGNVRHGSGLVYQGAWGAPLSGGHGRGQWDTGQLWLRYYAPDSGQGPLAGVALPRVHYELPDGRRFFVQVDTASFDKRVNRVVTLAASPPVEPSDKRLSGPTHGWFKQTGIFRIVVSGLAINTGWAGPEYVRQLDKGVASRGSDLPRASAYEQSATSATYVDYMSRGMELGAHKVVVLTGKLPTHPRTLTGEATMRAGEMRYWSIVGYEVTSGLSLLKLLDKDAVIGLAVHAVMDEELVLDAQRRYVIVLSRPEDRPRNAIAANGVTWVDWGPSSEVSWTLRWLTVGPEWTAGNAPTPQHLGKQVDWAEADFDASLIGTNSHTGAMGEYLPKVHYLDTVAFVALGSALSADQIPTWI